MNISARLSSDSVSLLEAFPPDSCPSLSQFAQPLGCDAVIASWRHTFACRWCCSYCWRGLVRQDAACGAPRRKSARRRRCSASKRTASRYEAGGQQQSMQRISVHAPSTRRKQRINVWPPRPPRAVPDESQGRRAMQQCSQQRRKAAPRQRACRLHRQPVPHGCLYTSTDCGPLQRDHALWQVQRLSARPYNLPWQRVEQGRLRLSAHLVRAAHATCTKGAYAACMLPHAACLLGVP